MGLPAPPHTSRKQGLLVFTGITLLFILSQTLFFQGFNGVDDLHYSFLAHRMLQGNFSPFVLNDLFAGRALLVAAQAVVYAIGGISTFTTQAASYTAAIVAAYLTVFKLISTPSPRLVLIASALFYFNPVLAGITLGTAPDVFILLAGIILWLLLKRLDSDSSKKVVVTTGVISGTLIFSTLLIKESGLVFLPFAIVYGLFSPIRKKLLFVVTIIASFSVVVALCGWVYYTYTGDFFFRIKQLQVAAYPNPCSYTSFFQKEMGIRLTYGVWREFLSQNFLPVLLAVVVIVQGWFATQASNIGKSNKRAFLILLLVSLYFPFSVSNYQPLCFKARHFLFLLPLGVAISSPWLEAGNAFPTKNWYRNTIAAALIGISIKMSNNGWNWDFYRCMLALLVFFPFLINKRIAAATPVLLAAILWLCLPYRFIFERTSWYQDSKNINTQLGGQYFYFADHDNLMHWKLFHHFDTAIHHFNLDPKPFHISNPYYEPLYFHPGWFIINRQYTTRSGQYLTQIDSLTKALVFEKTITKGVVSALYISNEQQFHLFQTAMLQEKNQDCNCNEREP